MSKILTENKDVNVLKNKKLTLINDSILIYIINNLGFFYLILELNTIIKKLI